MRNNAHSSADEVALYELIQPIVNGWNQGEGKVFAIPFTEDADYVAAPGLYIKGHQQIASGHQQIFDTIYRGSQLQAQIASIRFLTVDIALMHIHFTVQAPSGPEQKTLASLVAIRQGSGWGIASFHNTPLQR